jgi:hypothetical protein
MNTKCIRLFVNCFSVALFPNIVSAYYAAHIGRFTTRDPYGDTVRIGTEMEAPPDAGTRMEFIARDQFDPLAVYHDGMNLYQYAWSAPTGNSDSSGLAVTIVNCGGRWIHPSQGFCCGGKLIKSDGKTCCNNGVPGTCPPRPSCADEGDWLDCMACCINNGGVSLGVHAVPVGLGARVPKGRMLPGQTSTTSVYVKACQRLQLGGKAVKVARTVGRVGVFTTILDGVYSWSLTGSCAAACSGTN